MYNFVFVWLLYKVDHIRRNKISLDKQRSLLGYYILKIFTGLKKTGKEWQSISCKKNSLCLIISDLLGVIKKSLKNLKGYAFHFLAELPVYITIEVTESVMYVFAFWIPLKGNFHSTVTADCTSIESSNLRSIS